MSSIDGAVLNFAYPTSQALELTHASAEIYPSSGKCRPHQYGGRKDPI
jgi:hypothetical protein